jgi:hypothetical protein
MDDGPIITYDAPYNVPLSYQSDPFGYAGLETLIVKNGRDAYPGAASSYALLVFPAMPAASVKVLNEILALAHAGVPILLQSTVPSRSISLNGSDSEVVAIAAQLWGLAGMERYLLVMPALLFSQNLEYSGSYFYLLLKRCGYLFRSQSCGWRRCLLHQQWIEEASGCHNQSSSNYWNTRNMGSADWRASHPACMVSRKRTDYPGFDIYPQSVDIGPSLAGPVDPILGAAIFFAEKRRGALQRGAVSRLQSHTLRKRFLKLHNLSVGQARSLLVS